ncbi:hypothetical protein B0H17DRAFT_1140376, partial [Mycena rosella]
MGRQKRKSVRIPRESRRNLRLWAEGAREKILSLHLDDYAKAMDEGCYRPEEPILTDYDPAQSITKETLLDEDEITKLMRQAEINDRIRRWFKYRIKKLRKHRVSTGLDPTKDPFAVLLAKLSGVSSPPKARQAYQKFMPTEEDPGSWDGPKEPKAGFRAEVACAVFAKLPKEEQQVVGARAKAEADEARKAYMKVYQWRGQFHCPILRGVSEYTGLHSIIVMGGPMPKFGGEIRTVHVSYGRNSTAAAQHFPLWDKPRFNTNMLQFMTEYLKTAFSPQQCKAAALPSLVDLAQANTKSPRRRRWLIVVVFGGLFIIGLGFGFGVWRRRFRIRIGGGGAGSQPQEAQSRQGRPVNSTRTVIQL